MSKRKTVRTEAPGTDAAPAADSATTQTIEFQTRNRDPHPETVLHALAGVVLALDAEQFNGEMQQRDFERCTGLAMAARLLSEWLTSRI